MANAIYRTLFLGAAGVLLGQERAPEKGAIQGTISGTVTDSLTGAPLGKAEIRTEGPARLFTVSDAKGMFRLVDVPAGAYRLIGSRNGYLQGKGAAITVDAGQDVAGVSYKLTPFGVIAGTVRDPDGEALANVEVTAYRVIYRGGHRRVSQDDSVRTDDLGQYRMVGVEPGRYYVVAQPARGDAHQYEPQFPKGQPHEVSVPAFYPGVPDPAAAVPVRVDAGARVGGIDIAVARLPVVRVTGRVIAPPGTTAPNVYLRFAGNDESDGLGNGFTATVKADGEFAFPAVPSGSYVLGANTQPKARPTTDVMELFGRTVLMAEMPLHVGDAPVQDVRIAIQPPAAVSGVVSAEGEPDAKFTGRRVAFVPDGKSDTMASVREDQTFSTPLSQGRYAISHGFDNDYLVIKALADGRDVTDDGLTVTGPGKISVEVIVGKSWGKLGGVVMDKDGAPLSDVSVVLVPEERLRWRSDSFVYSQTDQKGGYQMRVPPGKYKLFAWKDVEDGAWFDPDFLRNYELKGVAITIEAKGQITQGLTVLP